MFKAALKNIFCKKTDTAFDVLYMMYVAIMGFSGHMLIALGVLFLGILVSLIMQAFLSDHE